MSFSIGDQFVLTSFQFVLRVVTVLPVPFSSHLAHDLSADSLGIAIALGRARPGSSILSCLGGATADQGDGGPKFESFLGARRNLKLGWAPLRFLETNM
eukprot:3548147-Pyramimonas_sp.AAC.1